jgi:hypothetical protein
MNAPADLIPLQGFRIVSAAPVEAAGDVAPHDDGIWHNVVLVPFRVIHQADPSDLSGGWPQS